MESKTYKELVLDKDVNDTELNEAYLKFQGYEKKIVNGVSLWMKDDNLYVKDFYINETGHDEFIETINIDLVVNGFDVN